MGIIMQNLLKEIVKVDLVDALQLLTARSEVL